MIKQCHCLPRICWSRCSSVAYTDTSLYSLLPGEMKLPINLQNTSAANFEDRFPKVYGQKLWLLVSAEESTLNTPAQEISANKTAGFLDIFTTTQSYTALLDDSSPTGSGYTLWAFLSTRLWERAPADCPTGFIWVPWNPEFNTERWFCVAQYEMTYSDADTPNSTGGGTDWNTVAYVPWKTIVSQAGKYPIADITQTQALAACQSMWPGYHLITNNQWMTIGRSIEANNENWSSGTVWVWNLYNGVSDNTALGCNAEWGNTDPWTYATKTWPWDVSCNLRRSHKLLQWWGVIWDFSGNVWEHVNKANTIDGNGYNSWQTGITGTVTNWVYAAADMQKYWAATWGGTAQGMGNPDPPAGVPSNIFARGGDALNNAGVFTLHINVAAVHENRSLGFRCVK